MNINTIHADMFYNMFSFSVKEAKPLSIAEASPCQFGMIVEVIPVRGAGVSPRPLCGAGVRVRKIFISLF